MKRIMNFQNSLRLVMFILLANVTNSGKSQFATPPTPTTPNNVTGHPLFIHGSASNGVYVGKGLLSTEHTNTAVGFQALANTTAGNPGPYGNTAVGQFALSNLTLGRANVAMGTGASQFFTGNNSVALGYNALRGALNTNTGDNNIAIGSSVFSNNTTGNNNVAVGTEAMQFNQTGVFSVAIGTNALQYNVSGANNTAVGVSSLQNNINTSVNSAFGVNALRNLNATGTASNEAYNSAFGYGTLATLTTGVNNSGFGHGNLFQLAVGDSNTSIGMGALSALQFGNNNVGIGHNAMVPGGAGLAGSPNDNKLSIQNIIYGVNMNNNNSSAVSIGVATGPVGVAAGGLLPAGSLAKLHVGGTLRIATVPTGTNAGNNFLFVDAQGVVGRAPVPTGLANCSNVNFVPVTNNTNGNMTCSQIFDNGTSVGINQTSGFGYTSLAGFQLGTSIPPSSGNYRLAVNGVLAAQAFFATSDSRFKEAVEPVKNAMSLIRELRPVSYNWRTKEFAERNFSQQRQIGFLAQEVAKVIPMAVVKNDDGYYSMNYTTIIPILTEGIKEQQAIIDEQKVQLANLQQKLEELTSKVNQLVPGQVLVKEDYLKISPNPVTQTSTVTYQLPDAASRAYIGVFDLQGKLLNSFAIPASNKSGSIQLSRSSLPAGMYIISLVSNGSEIQARKIIIAD